MAQRQLHMELGAHNAVENQVFDEDDAHAQAVFLSEVDVPSQAFSHPQKEKVIKSQWQEFEQNALAMIDSAEGNT